MLSFRGGIPRIMKDLIYDYEKYYEVYWERRFEENRPHMCEFCHFRISCLTDELINYNLCSIAWNNMVHQEGEPL